MLITKSGSTSYIYNRDSNSSLYLGANDVSNVLVITNNSNVLIGTTTDNGKKLQVNGDSTIYSTGTTDSFPLIVGQANAANNFVGIGLSGFIASNGAVKAAMVLERDG